ncbi:MAG TPA: acyl-CoA dehydrogenase [Mycobacteriales bacterium]|nr:acyl-CoA dehydrogenase [Mycobacteriales bacterium]
MGIGISPEHEELRAAVRDVLDDRCPRAVPRAALERSDDELPALWGELAALGWTGIAVPEEQGGGGQGLAELAIVIEELGRACAPGPFLPTALSALVIARGGSATQRKELLPGYTDGSTVAAISVEAAPGILHAKADGSYELTGDAGAVLGAGLANQLLIPVPGGRVAVIDADAPGVTITAVPSLDATRRLATVVLDRVAVPSERVLDVEPDRLAENAPPRVRDLAAVLACAEACGIAAWCLDTTSAYAKVREQFGRPIGIFQAVKHRLADTLVAVEQMRAATWDAAHALEEADDEQARLAVAIAASIALDGAVEAAQMAVQLHGGIGFTWEHDAHLYLKRAIALRAWIGPTTDWRRAVIGFASSGVRRALQVALPEEAERIRPAIVAATEEFAQLPDTAAKTQWIIDGGWINPHWPKPYGRNAGPVEQIVIDQEFRRARIRRPHLAVGAWALPTIIEHGTAEQQERFVLPTFRGEVRWCQLFSEPGAGSDLANLSTKAVRDDANGGWRITGQKVWTSMAKESTHGILLARTGSDGGDRRQGITYFLLDMSSPGVDIRPLKELTGLEFFNEVFFDDVFVPDADVCGEVGQGWAFARTTLANERVSMSSGASFGAGVEALVKLADLTDPVVVERLAHLVVEAQTIALLGARTTLRALSGSNTGNEASVRKLLGAEHEQRVQEIGLEWYGSRTAVLEGEVAAWVGSYLATRCLTIAGGTSEVQRNVIAERILGLPRDADAR